MEVALTIPQTEMILLRAKFPLFLAGYGAGKTQSLIVNTIRDILAFPGANIGSYAPTYDLIKLNLIPRLEEMMVESEIPFKLNKQENIFYVEGYGQIIMRSLDNPSRIVAYEVFRSHIDEIDTIAVKKAIDCWNKIVARNRQKVKESEQSAKLAMNTISAYTTPDHGFNSFTYKYWGGTEDEMAKKRTKGYELVQASTLSNSDNLPDDYVDTLKSIYPEHMVLAFVDGKWVNMAGKAIFDSSKFKRWEVLPKDITHMVIYGDTAQKEKEANDYTVFQCWGYSPTIGAILIDQIRGKWTSPIMRQKFIDFYNKHSAFDYEKSYSLRCAKIEDKSSGTGLIQEIAANSNIVIEAIPRFVDKITRALDILPQIAMGNVWIPMSAEWVSDYTKEFDEFTSDLNTHDDQIDPTMDAVKDLMLENQFSYVGAV